MVYQLQMQISDIKCIRRNNSYMGSLECFGVNKHQHSEHISSNLVKLFCRNLLRLQGSSEEKSRWGKKYRQK